ncbi:response regulator [Desulfococcaceae bacterium HSG8]|nr:response regulator [Desulfococcaceae bacterium HSG8]
MEQSVKVVLVDDNSDYRFTMGVFLERNGFEVITAEDGEKGWELIQKEKPDIILLDIMMESLFSGFEVCKRVREDAELKEIPIIGVSGVGDELGIRPDGQADFPYFSPDDFVEKPVNKEKLLVKIGEVLEKADKLRQRSPGQKKLEEETKDKYLSSLS